MAATTGTGLTASARVRRKNASQNASTTARGWGSSSGTSSPPLNIPGRPVRMITCVSGLIWRTLPSSSMHRKESAWDTPPSLPQSMRMLGRQVSSTTRSCSITWSGVPATISRVAIWSS